MGVPKSVCAARKDTGTTNKHQLSTVIDSEDNQQNANVCIKKYFKSIKITFYIGVEKLKKHTELIKKRFLRTV